MAAREKRNEGLVAEIARTQGLMDECVDAGEMTRWLSHRAHLSDLLKRQQAEKDRASPARRMACEEYSIPRFQGMC